MIVKVFDQGQVILQEELVGPLQLGRQKTGEPPPPKRVVTQEGGRSAVKLIIARLEDATVGRNHALLEPIPGKPTHVRLTNQSSVVPIQLHPGDPIPALQVRDVPLPVLFTLGTRAIRVEESEVFESLAGPTLQPGQSLLTGGGSAPQQSLVSLFRSNAPPNPEHMLDWLQSTVSVLQQAASAPEFLPQAAQAALNAAALDNAAVLRLRDDTWTIAAHASASGSDINWRPSHTILTRVREEKRTLFKPQAAGQNIESLTGVTTLVAAPILNARGEVVGALYGDRRTATAMRSPMTNLEAKVIEVLACGVAAGLARLEQEQFALAQRVQFEQFVTPEVAAQLEADPEMLAGREANVTLLFCDIAGFSRISERLGPRDTVAWVNDVMETLSECVRDEQGTLVDYIGDELIAMWGAPLPCTDHAVRACRAAIAMLRTKPRLDARWRARLGEPIDFGIGINTGVVQVGNTGTRRKLKYGPLGGDVNLASRVQGATRYLRTNLLITGAVRRELGAEFPCRRLSRVKVKHIEQAVDLYEIPADASPAWLELDHEYERALDLWEAGDVMQTMAILSNLVPKHPTDGPLMLLLARAIDIWTRGQPKYDSHWELPGK